MDERLRPLLEDGSILGYSDDDETVQFDWPVFSNLHPELAQAIWLDHRAEVDGHLFSLADKGYLDLEVVVMANGEFDLKVSLTDLGRSVLG